MPFFQLKVTVQVTCGDKIQLGRYWTLSKHKPHITFAEFYVHPSLLDELSQWVSQHSATPERIASQTTFSAWHVFFCKDKHFAILAPDSPEFRDLDLPPGHLPKAPSGLLDARTEWLTEMLEHFGCSTRIEPVEIDGLPIWQYRRPDSNLILFSFNRYNQPAVWYPHVTIALRFNHLEANYPTETWPSAFAEASAGGLWFEAIDKPVLVKN